MRRQSTVGSSVEIDNDMHKGQYHDVQEIDKICEAGVGRRQCAVCTALARSSFGQRLTRRTSIAAATAHLGYSQRHDDRHVLSPIRHTASEYTVRRSA